MTSVTDWGCSIALLPPPPLSESDRIFSLQNLVQSMLSPSDPREKHRWFAQKQLGVGYECTNAMEKKKCKSKSLGLLPPPTHSLVQSPKKIVFIGSLSLSKCWEYNLVTNVGFYLTTSASSDNKSKMWRMIIVHKVLIVQQMFIVHKWYFFVFLLGIPQTQTGSTAIDNVLRTKIKTALRISHKEWINLRFEYMMCTFQYSLCFTLHIPTTLALYLAHSVFFLLVQDWQRFFFGKMLISFF